jgi:HK97 family phage major capsid protein
VLFSKQEAADADDIGEFLKRIAFSRAARATEYALLTGKDNGTVSQLTHSPVGGLLVAAPVGVSAVATTGPTYAQMAALAASVDVSYRNAPGAGFYVNPTTFSFLVSAVTTTGAPLYEFGDDGLLRVAGKPVYVSAANAMPSYSTSGAVIALFGDYSRAYKFVDVGGPRLQILTQRFADQFLNQAVISQRLASAALVSGAVKSMTIA